MGVIKSIKTNNQYFVSVIFVSSQILVGSNRVLAEFYNGISGADKKHTPCKV